MSGFNPRLVEKVKLLCSFDGIIKTISFFFLTAFGFLITQIDVLKKFIGLELPLERFGIFGYFYIILLFPASATFLVFLIACYFRGAKLPCKIPYCISLLFIVIINLLVCWGIYRSSQKGQLWIHSKPEISQITVRKTNNIKIFNETPNRLGEYYRVNTKIPFGSYNLIINYLDIDNKIKRELLPISINLPKDTIDFQTPSSMIDK